MSAGAEISISPEPRISKSSQRCRRPPGPQAPKRARNHVWEIPHPSPCPFFKNLRNAFHKGQILKRTLSRVSLDFAAAVKAKLAIILGDRSSANYRLLVGSGSKSTRHNREMATNRQSDVRSVSLAVTRRMKESYFRIALNRHLGAI